MNSFGGWVAIAFTKIGLGELLINWTGIVTFCFEVITPNRKTRGSIRRSDDSFYFCLFGMCKLKINENNKQ